MDTLSLSVSSSMAREVLRQLEESKPESQDGNSGSVSPAGSSTNKTLSLLVHSGRSINPRGLGVSQALPHKVRHQKKHPIRTRKVIRSASPTLDMFLLRHLDMTLSEMQVGSRSSLARDYYVLSVKQPR